MKKNLRHFNRGVLIGLEIIGILALVVIFGWMGLIWRLSQGPLDASFLTQRIEKAFHAQQQGFDFHVGKTMLVWGGHFNPMELELNNLQIMRPDKTPVFAVDKVGVLFSKRYLLFGKLVPKEITVYGPALRVLRWEDGHFTLNLGAPPVPVYGPPAPPTISKGREDFIAALFTQMKKKDPLGLLGGLERIEVLGAALAYEDKFLQVEWKSGKTDIIISRSDDGIMSEAAIQLELEQGQKADLRTKISYDWETGVTTALMALNGFSPTALAQQSEKLKVLSGIDLPLKGSVAIALDKTFKPSAVRFILGADPGQLSGGGLYAVPVAVKSLYLAGNLDLQKWSGSVDQLRLDLDGPQILAKAQFFEGEGGRHTALQAELSQMPIDALQRYWPESLAVDARHWVTTHLSAGMAQKATLDTDISFDENNKLVLHKLGGGIDFTGIKTNYFPPLMPVLDVAGRATYDRKSFNLDLRGGKLGDMTVKNSVIKITGLDVQTEEVHSKIDIAVALEGPLKTALGVLDSDPLKYPSMLGLQLGDVGGAVDMDVTFKFPLYKDLRLEEVDVTAKATARNVRLTNVVSDMPLTGGPMEVSFTGRQLRVKGNGILADMPVTFDWMRDFSDGAPVAGKVEARLPLNATALAKFGVPEDLKVKGSILSDLTYTENADQTAILSLRGDLSQVGFVIPVVEKEKPVGVPGAVSLMLHTQKGKAVRVSGLEVVSDGLFIAGDIGLRENAAGRTILEKATFKNIKMDDTDISLEVSGGAGGDILKISGRQLDISRFVEGKDKKSSDAEAARPVTPLTLSLNVSRLVTGKNKSIEPAKLFMKRSAFQRIDQFEMDGVAGGSPLYIRYMPVKGGHSLRLETDNAGAALSALGITGGVRKGRLVIDAQPAVKSGPRDMNGSIMLTNFTLVDMPVLARLLNAMSLTGIIELLNGRGVAFKKARADFSWIDRGQPTEEKNIRLIHVKNGQTSGASLGLTFEGNIDNWNNLYDLNGTIIPVSDVNKLLSAIPLVGDVLTAGGEGVFAATYTIKGPTDQPTVTVNPIAALAPGILRKIFFE